jgi:competence protein ComEC
LPFLVNNKPEYSVISCSKYNRFNHPSPVTLNRLENIGSEVLRTDKLGAVIIESDGYNIDIVEWK